MADKSITISGSSIAKTILSYYEPLLEQQSGVEINLIANNSKQGLLDLINGDADIAVISTPLSLLTQELPNMDTSSLRSFPLGKSSIAFITHLNNPVKKLSNQQIKEILLGKITSWKELGGQDEDILIITELPGAGIRTEVEQQLLGSSLTIPVKVMENAGQIKDVVASIPNSLGITSNSLVSKLVNIIETDKIITQPIIFVAKPSPNEHITRFMKALSVINLHEIY